MAGNIKKNRNSSNNKKNKSKKKSKAGKIVRWTLLILLLCILGFAITMFAKLAKIRNEAIDIVKERGSEVFKEDLTTVVYDINGNIIANLSSEKDAYYMNFDDIPYMVKQIFLVTEDRKFYDHEGVDYKSILRAFVELIKNEGEITQGGSTITQQLARNTYLSHEVSFDRKLKEMFIAKEIEDKYSKDEILEFYINNIYFANGLYGVQAASKGYFNKDVSELSLSQLCYICAIPNNPENYNPIENPENTLKRRDRILKQLVDENVIDMEEYEAALSEEITLVLSEKIKNNYVETFVRYSATRELMAANGFKFRYFFDTNEEKEAYTEEYNEVYGECNSMLFTGGYRIYTSIDMEKQNLLQAKLDSRLSSDMSVNEEGVYELQGSAVCIDNATGYVNAIVGGRTQESEGYTLNRAYQSFRQPGSSIKPVLVYTPLFERGYTPDSQVVDERIVGGPANSPNVYAGNISIRTALAVSKNTIAWKMFDLIGYNKCISYLLNMQYSHIVREDYVPAMSIGGMTYGVSALEQAAAYATLANDGMYRTPTCIVKITDSFGEVVIDNQDREEKMIYEENAVLMTSNVLKDVLEWGTGKDYKVENAICAGKTGTTNNNRDTWFAGYSKYYTTVVWCGYDMPKTIDDAIVKSAGQIWNSFMEEVHTGLEKKDFDVYIKEGTERNEIETTKQAETILESPEEAETQITEPEGMEQTATILPEQITNPEEIQTFPPPEQETSYEYYIPETSEGDGIYIESY